MLLKRPLRAEPSVALHATDVVLHLFHDVAPFAYSAAGRDQPGLSGWLQIRDVDFCMGRNCISGDPCEVGVSPAVELAVKIFVLGGLAAALALFDALPEAVHSTGQLRDVSLPCISHLFVVGSNPRVDLLRRHFFACRTLEWGNPCCRWGNRFSQASFTRALKVLKVVAPLALDLVHRSAALAARAANAARAALAARLALSQVARLLLSPLLLLVPPLLLSPPLLPGSPSAK